MAKARSWLPDVQLPPLSYRLIVFHDGCGFPTAPYKQWGVGTCGGDC